MNEWTPLRFPICATRKGVRLGVRSSRQLVGDNLVTVWVLAQGRDPTAVRGRQKASEAMHPLACRAIHSSLMTPSPLPAEPLNSE